MSTTYPGSIQRFPTMENITAADLALVKQYHDAIDAGDATLAQQIYNSIENADAKFLTSELFNTMADTVVAVQTKMKNEYTPAYILSTTQPTNQSKGDYWFEITAVENGG